MGKGGGKKKGKIVFAAIGLVAGGFGYAALGASSWFAGAMMGASIASTLWSVTNKQNPYGNIDSDYSQDDYSRFNKVANDINQNAVIPVIYGTRKFGGLQTWHNPYNGNRYLQKDVIICEAGIDNIFNVCANEELIKDDTNISIYNIQYTDAKVSRPNSSTLRLVAGGITQEYTLGNVDKYDAQTSLLNTVIDKIKAEAGNGWKIDGAVDDRTSKGISANAMQFNSSTPVSCYVNPDDYIRDNAVVLDNRGYKIGTYEFHNGDIPSNYEVVGGYPQCAWIRSDLVASNRLGGSNPTINAHIKGMKVPVLKNNIWVNEYSENPAWIIRDFLISKRYGTGNWITEDMLDNNSFKEVAEYCDEIIEYIDYDGLTKSVPRYKLNIVLDSQKTPIDHLSSMLAVFGGFLTVGKQIALKVEKAETPVYAFDDSTIVKDSMSIGQTSLDETPNRYKVGYFDPNQEWTEVKVVVEDLELQHEQGNRITEKTVTLAGCTSQNQALRIARLYRDLNKVCSLTVSFSVATQGMMLECGDVITVTYGGIFKDLPVRITQIDETNTGIYQLTCRQYNASIYNDELGAAIVNPNYSNISSTITNGIPAPENLNLVEDTYINQDGSINSSIIATWDIVDYSNILGYQVSLSTNGITYEGIATTYDNKIRIPNLKIGEKYYVAIQVISSMGISSPVIVSNITLIGKNTAPQPVANIIATTYADRKGYLTATWDSNLEPDISHYEINIAGTTYKIIDTHFDIQLQATGSYTLSIVAVDTSGNRSEPSNKDVEVICEPSNVPKISVTQKDSNRAILEISWDSIMDIDRNSYEVRIGEYGTTWDNSTFVVRTQSLNCEYTLSKSANYMVFIKAINATGFYSKDATTAVIPIVLEPNVVSNINAVTQPKNRAENIISWDAVSGDDIRGYEISIAKNNEFIIQDYFTSSVNYTFVAEETAGYEIFVRAVTIANFKSEYATKDISFDIEPSNVKNLDFNQKYTDRTILQISWSSVLDRDIDYYEVRLTNTGSWNDGIVIAKTKATNMEYEVIESATYKVMVKAVNVCGAYSNEEASRSKQIILEPDSITDLTLIQQEKDRSEFRLSWVAPYGGDIKGYVINIKNNNTSVLTNYFTTETDYSWNIDVTGLYDISISSLTIVGFMSNAITIQRQCSIEPYDITGLSVIQSQSDKSQATLTWNLVNSLDVVGYEIREGTSWDNYNTIIGKVSDNKAVVKIDKERQYTWWVVAISKSGKISQFPQKISAAMSLRPNTPTNIQVIQDMSDSSLFTLSFDAIADVDLMYYEIRLGDYWENSRLLTKTQTTTFQFRPVDTSSYIKIMVKAKNNSGYYSDELWQTLYALLEPSDVTGFYAYQNGEYVQFVWNPPETADIQSYEIREGQSFNTGSLVGANLTGTTHKIQIDFNGEYTYWIKAINRIGKYSINAPKYSVAIDNLPDKNIISTTDVLTAQNGTHNQTVFGQSTLSFANLGGRFSDWKNLRFDDIGGSSVLKLATDSSGLYYSNGIYTSQVIDLGKKLSAKVAIRFKTNSVVFSSVSAILQARFSIDGVTWTEWRDFQPSEYTLRFIEVRVLLTTYERTKTPEVNTLIVYIDMPDLEKTGSVQVPTGGTYVEYDEPFYIIPVTVATAIGQNIRCEITQPNKDKFFIKVVDVNTGASVGGNVDWRSKGY